MMKLLLQPEFFALVRGGIDRLAKFGIVDVLQEEYRAHCPSKLPERVIQPKTIVTTRGLRDSDTDHTILCSWNNPGCKALAMLYP